MAITLESFMNALSGQESGGNYGASNTRTGAHGRWQILPSNWPSWSREAGIPGADPNDPQAQDIVAAYKLQQYYNQFGNWADVASAWYSGSPLSAYSTAQRTRKQGPNGDEPSIQEYVDSVISRAGGDSVNGRAPVAGGIKFNMSGIDVNNPIGTLLSAVRGIKPATTKSTGTYSAIRYTPTGNFQADAQGYFQAAQDAWNKLNDYQMGSKDPLSIDDNAGVVYRITGTNPDDGSVTSEVDPQATKLLQAAMAAEADLDRLYGAKKAGLFDSGETAAAAYLANEKEKAAEASRKYDDYQKRIGDLIALEDIPVKRAQDLASVLNTVNDANSKRQGVYDTKMYVPNGVKYTDTSQFANAIKKTIPAEAPQPYNISPGAFGSLSGQASPGPSPASVPMPPPGGTSGQTVPYPTSGQASPNGVVAPTPPTLADVLRSILPGIANLGLSGQASPTPPSPYSGQTFPFGANHG